LFDKYVRFIRAVSVNRIGLTGVALVTSAVVTFLLLELARVIGLMTNTYAGLVTYLAFPVIFVIGLVLIPIGWRQRKKATGKSARELLDERFGDRSIVGSFFGSTVFRTVAIFTGINIVIFSAASSRMLQFMDEPEFCGTACHSVMNPEWVTYQQSPHARVKCVECHVGEGVGALIDSKLNGMWQMVSVTFDLLERPIPTPVHQLRPARETCEKCHWPDKFYGSRLKTVARYARNETSTPHYTSLNLKIDAGKHGQRAGIHWHIAEESEVRYASVDDEREEMIWVEVSQDDGSFKRYTNTALVKEPSGEQDVRTFDCVDCHNRATHIYEDPQKAIDDRLARGLMDRSLPFLKREVLAAVSASYPDTVAARAGITNHIEGFYRRQYGQLASRSARQIDEAVRVAQQVYSRNVHPGMNIEWNSYPSMIGHPGPGQGCFRCHNEHLVDEAGEAMSSDCTLCHSILAFDSDRPLKFLQPVDTTDVNAPMHRQLQAEFFESVQE